MASLFTINGKDYTNLIVAPSYKVNYEEEYEEWTDANYTIHHEVTRGRIKGDFSIKFHDENDYRGLIHDLETNRTTGNYIRIGVYVNNKDTFEIIDAYVKLTVSNIVPYLGRKKTDSFTVEVEER